LLLKSGTVAREYIGGKRKKYFNPFTFFLILAALFILSNTFFSPVSVSRNPEIPVSVQNMPDPVKKAEVIEMIKRGANVRYFTSKYGNILP